VITYTVEPWDDYFRDCQDLWVEHYEEIGTNKDKMPMGPHIEGYEWLESQGQLQIICARKEGLLIGYSLVIIRRHLHYPTFCGFEDSYFVRKSERKGTVGIRLIKETLSVLEKRGVKKVFFLTKEFLDRGPVFERLGFKKCDTMYSKWLGE